MSKFYTFFDRALKHFSFEKVYFSFLLEKFLLLSFLLKPLSLAQF